MCHCAACHATFAGVTIFEMHRVGDFHGRRCLTPIEMACLQRKGGQPRLRLEEHAGAAVWHNGIRRADEPGRDRE